MPTGQQIQVDESWVEEQGYQVTTLDQERQREDWYRPDGLKIPQLPVDPYHRGVYRAKGWSLKPPTFAQVTAWKAEHPAAAVVEKVAPLSVELQRELAEVTKTPPPVPPRHMHVYQTVEIGAACLVLGCVAVRLMSQGMYKSKKSKKSKEA